MMSSVTQGWRCTKAPSHQLFDIRLHRSVNSVNVMQVDQVNVMTLHYTLSLSFSTFMKWWNTFLLLVPRGCFEGWLGVYTWKHLVNYAKGRAVYIGYQDIITSFYQVKDPPFFCGTDCGSFSKQLPICYLSVSMRPGPFTSRAKQTEMMKSFSISLSLAVVFALLKIIWQTAWLASCGRICKNGCLFINWQ